MQLPIPQPTTEQELLLRAKALCHRTVGEVAAMLHLSTPANSRHGKGFTGQLAEWCLGADQLAGTGPDFSHLGIELKTLPISPAGKPLESTFVCSIQRATTSMAHWEQSIVAKRLRRVLWLPVAAQRGQPIAQRTFLGALCWSPNPTQQEQLADDFQLLMGEIGAGRGLFVGGQVGIALQLRPKAAHGRIRVQGGIEDDFAQVPPLGFYLRAKWTYAMLTQAGWQPGQVMAC